MIVELIEERKHNGEPWYIVTVDGVYTKGTGNKIIAEAFYNDVIADPEILKNAQLASPATARANKVLPFPGSPAKRTPFGILAPIFLNF